GLKPRSFPSFAAAAKEAAISRLYGGIHYRAAVEMGADQGRCIGAYAVALHTWKGGMLTTLLRLSALGLAAALFARAAAAGDSPATPHFVEETQSAGVDSVYAGGWQYMVGGGVATFDCNGDGFPDMLLAGGESPAKFYRNTSSRGGALHFAVE